MLTMDQIHHIRQLYYEQDKKENLRGFKEKDYHSFLVFR